MGLDEASQTPSVHCVTTDYSPSRQDKLLCPKLNPPKYDVIDGAPLFLDFAALLALNIGIGA